MRTAIELHRGKQSRPHLKASPGVASAFTSDERRMTESEKAAALALAQKPHAHRWVPYAFSKDSEICADCCDLRAKPKEPKP